MYDVNKNKPYLIIPLALSTISYCALEGHSNDYDAEEKGE